MKLDAKTVAGLALPDGKEDDVKWDDELPRFGLRLRRSGKRTLKTWVVHYRVNGKRGKAAFGDAQIVPVSKAREAARKHLAEVALGYDPQAERLAKRRAAEMTFAKVVAAYLADYQRTMRPSTVRVAKLYLTRTYFESLHAMAITEIGFADIAAAVRAIENGHTAIVAWAARKVIAAMFTWAISEGLLGKNPVNPVIGTRRPALPPQRDRVLSTPELAAIWQGTGEDAQTPKGWRDFCLAIRLLMLLGARETEVGAMTWGELDPVAGTWTIPKERAKNHRSLTVVLPPTARAIIAEVERHPQHDCLFGDTPRGFRRWAPNKDMLDRRLGGRVGPWRIHDLRRSLATGMADIGIMPHVIEACLNHVSGHQRGVAGIYNRSRYTGEVTAALVRWSDHLLAVVEGRAGANVVPLRSVS